jgi:hypothetical protein
VSARFSFVFCEGLTWEASRTIFQAQNQQFQGVQGGCFEEKKGHQSTAFPHFLPENLLA